MNATEARRLIVVLTLFFSAASTATTITEGLDYADGPNPNIGVIDVGITMVRGSIEGECAGPGLPFICTFGAGPGADPLDRFTFDIAAGAAVTNIEFDLISGLIAPAGFKAELAIDAAVFSGLLPGIYSVSPPSPLTDPVTLAISGDEADLSGSYSLDWTVTIEAVAVSEPAPLALLVVAAGLIGFQTRRKRRHPN